MTSGAPPLLPDGAELRETHISWVFLTGDRAYKVKKPLVLPFLDYGTPARRHAMCRREVELNRRLAPDVYLGVRALVPAGAGLRLAAEDDPDAVDYAVEMRRYREADTLAARLAAARAGEADFAALGGRMAAFHASAEACDGGAEPVKRSLDDNFATLRAAGGDRALVTRLERSAGAFLAAIWDELDARAGRGLVRDGHGDLRLEHVLVGAEISVVDCVEFDAGLRRIDVVADLAFPIMELHERGRPDLARALVGAYRDAGGDPGTDALLAFFAAYRAEVRAKVALVRAAQLSSPGADAARAHATALLELAERLRWSARAPLVLALAGLSASGKSTIARELAARSGYATLSSDLVRKRTVGLQPAERAPQALYDDAADRATYARLGELAAARAAGGVIVDATFRRRLDRDAFRASLGDDVDLLFVECRAPAHVLEARARARISDPARVSDAGPEIVRAQLATAEPLYEVPAFDHAILRSDRSVDEIVGAIAAVVDARTPSSVVPRSRIRDRGGVKPARV